MSNYEYGSAAVDDPRCFAENEPEQTDAERDLDSLIDAQAACTDAWEAARYAPAILAAIEAAEREEVYAGAPETGDITETTEGHEPSEREMSPFDAMVFGIGPDGLSRALAELRAIRETVGA